MRFVLIRGDDGTEHRSTKPHHAWTHGQDRRLNRTISEATDERFYHDGQKQLRRPLAGRRTACNLARPIGILGGLGPCGDICKARTSDRDQCVLNPTQRMRGRNT